MFRSLVNWKDYFNRLLKLKDQNDDGLLVLDLEVLDRVRPTSLIESGPYCFMLSLN